MFKKIFTILLSIIISFTFNMVNNKPLFLGFSDKFELYLGSSSSTAMIVLVDENTFINYKNVCGESFKAEKNNFDLENFLQRFNAKIVFTETIEQGISYYAYSNKIKYKKTVRGKLVNLQIFIGDMVTVGAPIIFGSF